MTSSQRYSEYLKSDYWQTVTRAAKARAKYRCQICNSPHDLNAHHRSYEHRGNELEHLDDLVCLCRRCHETFHGKAQAQPPKVITVYVASGLPGCLSARDREQLLRLPASTKPGSDTHVMIVTGAMFRPGVAGFPGHRRARGAVRSALKSGRIGLNEMIERAHSVASWSELLS